jgi:amino acid adenylation domain-containing protein
MLHLPTHRPEPVSGAVHRRAWDLAGWSAFEPGVARPRLLATLLAVLVHRYGLPGQLFAEPGCGAVDAALAVLDAAPREATWPAVLAAVTGAERAAVTPAAHVPVMLVGTGTGTVDADLCWTASEAGMSAWWRPEVYPDETVVTIAGHLDRLVAALSTPDAPPLADVCFLTAEERVRNGGTPATLPAYPPVTLHQLLMLQAWRTPDACALLAEDGSLTYRELDVASNRLAHRLVDAGIRAGDVVAVGGDRSLGLFTALVAVLKAGGVFVHLDPAFPVPRLRQFVEVSRPRLVLTGPDAPPLHHGLPELSFAGVPDPTGPGPDHPPDVLVGAESPAYLLFTSGSTGVPKGVLRPHRLHTSRVFLEQGVYRLGPEDRHLLKMAISAREVFWPLATGGTAVIARPGGERDDAYLVGLIRRVGITVLSAVPSMLHAFAANPQFGRCRSLRHIFVGGEALHHALEERVRSLGFAVHNTYTLTEADYVTHRKDPLGPAATDTSVIGVPLDMRVYLCDEHGRLVPPGLTGEILTGGPGLASGYYRDAERTAERFLPNPFGDPVVPVLFRTGDLACHLDDGTLAYRGRRDLQVKVRGQRVEPTDVESWLRRHPAVRNAAVVGYPDAEQGAVLVGFLVCRDDAPTDRQLREFLGERIPAYLVPRHFARVPRLPLLTSGKIDRASLRLPERARPADLPAPARAETPTQDRLLAVWRRILQQPEVGVDDDYTALGGDSLRVLLLRSAIQDEFGVPVELAALYGASTVRAQARLLDAGPAATNAPAATSVPAATDAPAGDDPRAALLAVAGERARRAALRATVVDAAGREPAR